MAAECNDGVVRVVRYDAVLCFSERCSTVRATVDYTLCWEDDGARTVALDMLGLEIFEIYSIKDGADLQEADSSSPDCSVRCSHRKGPHRRYYGCCTPPYCTLRGKLRYEFADAKVHVQVTRDTQRIRVKFELPLYRTEDRTQQDTKQLEDALQWWASRSFLHSAGGNSGQMCLLPYVDTVDQRGDWHVQVCVPQGYGAYVSSPLLEAPVPTQCGQCMRQLFRFSAPRLVPSALGVLIAKNLRYHTIITDPIPVHLVVQCRPGTETPFFPIDESFTDVVASLLEGILALFGDIPFESYSIVAIHPGWTMQGLSVYSGCLLNESMVAGVSTVGLGKFSLAVLILAHEMCHEWFGNRIKGLNQDDFWLDEAFAVFCELRVLQLALGQCPDESRTQYLLRSVIAEGLAEASVSSINTSGVSVSSGDYRVVRSKGFLILVKLMLQYPDLESFDEFIRAWLERHSGGVTTEAFALFYARHSHKTLGRAASNIPYYTIRGWVASTDLSPGLRVTLSDEDGVKKKLAVPLRDIERVVNLSGKRRIEALRKWALKGTLLFEKMAILLDRLIAFREAYVSATDGACAEGREAPAPLRVPMAASEVASIASLLPSIPGLSSDAEILNRIYELAILTRCAELFESLEAFAMLHRDYAPYFVSCTLLYPYHNDCNVAYRICRDLVQAGQTAAATDRLNSILLFRLGEPWRDVLSAAQERLKAQEASKVEFPCGSRSGSEDSRGADAPLPVKKRARLVAARVG